MHERWLGLNRFVFRVCARAFILIAFVSSVASPRSRAADSVGEITVEENPIAAVVTIVSADANGELRGVGCGFFVSETGLLATPRHMLDDTSKAAARTADGKIIPIIGVVAEDPVHDVLIVQVKISGCRFLKLGNFSSITLSELVRVIPDPMVFSGKAITGPVVIVEDLVGDYQWFAVATAIENGMSGAPVLNDKNEVLGMITNKWRDAAQGFANPVTAISRLLAHVHRQSFPISKLEKRTYDDLINDPDFTAALAAWDHKNPTVAADLMKKTLTRFPKSPACYVLLAGFYSAKHDWQEAETAYLRALALREDYPLAWAYLSAVYGLEHKYDAGFDAAFKATKSKPDLPEGWSNLAGLYIATKEFDKAEKTLNVLEKIGTPHAEEMAASLKRSLEKERATAPKQER
jgi:hypothetical protein